jgi:hypothetical protein
VEEVACYASAIKPQRTPIFIDRHMSICPSPLLRTRTPRGPRRSRSVDQTIIPPMFHTCSCRHQFSRHSWLAAHAASSRIGRRWGRPSSSSRAPSNTTALAFLRPKTSNFCKTQKRKPNKVRRVSCGRFWAFKESWRRLRSEALSWPFGPWLVGQLAGYRGRRNGVRQSV